MLNQIPVVIGRFLRERECQDFADQWQVFGGIVAQIQTEQMPCFAPEHGGGLDKAAGTGQGVATEFREMQFFSPNPGSGIFALGIALGRPGQTGFRKAVRVELPNP